MQWPCNLATNHKFCKILPKFSSTLHFLQDSYKFVQKLQIFQTCYNVEQNFLQNSNDIFAKNAFFVRNYYKKMWCVISTKISKIIKLPATTATVAVYNAQTVPGSQQKGQNC